MTTQVEVVSQLPARPRRGATYSFARLSRGDVTYGSHGLHKYPAKFIPQFPKWGLTYDPDTPASTVLDPFCGSGTTLVEAGLIGANAIGCDVSPLAVLITEAKCSTNAHTWDTESHLNSLLVTAKKSSAKLERTLTNNKGNACLGMHHTWGNWFEPLQLARLLAIREAIQASECTLDLKTFSLAILSSVVKACSYLNEDQIKVRFDHDKQLADPYVAFRTALTEATRQQAAISRAFAVAGSSFNAVVASASSIPLAPATVDRIITSPPYINAVDYTMAHKYNMFVLGLLEPESFKEHCREYIGVTERAVRVADMASIPDARNATANDVVRQLLGQDTSTARNRAYVVAQYFSGMYAAFESAYSVLKDRGLYVFVVGETNRICGLQVPTAQVLKEQAQSVGFSVEVDVYHELANRSSMRLSRSATGGTIGREQVYVFRK